MKKVAVILSGCGFKDGSEITEAVSSLIGLSQLGASYQCFAPSMAITSTDHLSGEKSDARNVLNESARIARGNCKDLKTLNTADFDALLFPGGFGAALNLCDWAVKGAASTVHPDVEKVVQSFYKAGKPMGAICIAPVILAKVLGKNGISITIGDDKETATEIQKTGATHEDCSVTEYISDRNNKILTTPAYMYEAQPHEVFTGITKMLKELVEMA